MTIHVNKFWNANPTIASILAIRGLSVLFSLSVISTSIQFDYKLMSTIIHLVSGAGIEPKTLSFKK